jgi:hypothetical protein
VLHSYPLKKWVLAIDFPQISLSLGYIIAYFFCRNNNRRPIFGLNLR